MLQSRGTHSNLNVATLGDDNFQVGSVLGVLEREGHPVQNFYGLRLIREIVENDRQAIVPGDNRFGLEAGLRESLFSLRRQIGNTIMHERTLIHGEEEMRTAFEIETQGHGIEPRECRHIGKNLRRQDVGQSGQKAEKDGEGIADELPA